MIGRNKRRNWRKGSFRRDDKPGTSGIAEEEGESQGRQSCTNAHPTTALQVRRRFTFPRFLPHAKYQHPYKLHLAPNPVEA